MTEGDDAVSDGPASDGLAPDGLAPDAGASGGTASDGVDAPGVPPTPAAAEAVFGPRLPVAEHFVELLADTGISHGLIGPREGPRLWDRHVLNCAIVHRLIPVGEQGQRLIDVGSGAGLPGLALAIARPDLEVHLVEPLARRTGWLSGVAAALELPNVTIHTARAEAMWDRLTAPWVTARAVSGIVQLARWTLPLLSPGGSLLALKGSKAAAELAEGREALSHLGAEEAAIEVLGEGIVVDPTIVLRVTIGDAVDRRRFRNQLASSAGSARRRADRPRSGQRYNASGQATKRRSR